MSDDKPWKNKEKLVKLYKRRGMSTREIADQFGCSNGTISRWLERHNIETRENWKRGVEVAKEVNRKEYVKQRALPSGYEYWTTTEYGDSEYGNGKIVYIHRLLAVAEYSFDSVKDQDVHHKNGIPWDNRPDNIELLDKEEHGSIHANERHHGERVSTL